MTKETELSRSACRRLIKKYTGKRVGRESADSLRNILEGHAELIANSADKKAEYTGRKTIQSEDIHLAVRELW